MAISTGIALGVFLRFKRHVDGQAQLKLCAIDTLLAYLVVRYCYVKKVPAAFHDLGFADQKHTVGHARAIAWHLFQNFFDQAAYRQGSITMLKIPPSLPRCCLSIFANPLNTHWNLVPLCDVNELIE